LVSNSRHIISLFNPDPIARAGENAARQASIDLAQSGRRSTIFAGEEIAQENQLLRVKKRRAARDLTG